MTDQERLDKARASWLRALLILQGTKGRRGERPMEEDAVHKIARQRMAEIAALKARADEMRKAITDYVLVSGFHIFPDLAAKFPELLCPVEEITRTYNVLKAFAERIDDDPPLFQRHPGGGRPGPSPQAGGPAGGDRPASGGP